MSDAPDWLKKFAAPLEDCYTCREFRKEDGILEGVEIDHPICGGTVEKDGKPVAYAGVNLIAGRHWVFMFIHDDNLRKPLWLLRLMRDSLEAYRRAGVTELYALCDDSKPSAPQFLRKIGFEPLPLWEKPVDVMVYEKLMGAKSWRRIDKGA